MNVFSIFLVEKELVTQQNIFSGDFSNSILNDCWNFGGSFFVLTGEDV